MSSARLKGELNQWGLTEKDCKIIKNVLSKNTSITCALLFGSRATGTFGKASDIDLSLEGENLDLADLAFLRGEFAESSLPYEVDLVIRADIVNPVLEDHIGRYGTIFYVNQPPKTP